MILTGITRSVWILSLISMLTDMASEMLYPVMPVYLKSIGFSVMLIGILEGIADATAGLCKVYFGKFSDLSGRRVPFVRFGYALSAVSKPMIAFFTYPLWIFLARTAERFGKGIRTGARDAMLSEAATPFTKGRIFGFHRAMDTLGAVIGTSFSLVYLYFRPGDYIMLFYVSFFPGLLAVLVSLMLSEKQDHRVNMQSLPSFFTMFSYLKESPIAYRRLIYGLLVFALFNSSDVFLLLKAKQYGLDDTVVIGIYIFYNLIYALFAFPAGIVADKIGLKTIFICGLALFALVYLGMSASLPQYLFYGLFFLYGMYAAATEGVSKAWITSIADKKDAAAAVGTYSGMQSICTMLASMLTGFLWFRFGAAVAFMTTALVTFVVIIYFLFVPSPAVEKKLKLTK